MSRIDRAYTLHTQGELAAAEDIYRSMIRDDEDAISAANNLFALLQGMGRSRELIELYWTIEPKVSEHGDWAFNLAEFLLMRGEFAAGWTWYEARRHVSYNRVAPPALSIPEWEGGPVERLLVLREQGRGDEIQFARYLHTLAARGIDATFLCRPELARLLRSLPGEVIGATAGLQVGGFDAWCFVASLPRILGAPFEIPPPVNVTAEPRRRGGVGLMTAGSTIHRNALNRSLSQEAAARLSALPNAISLRPEDTGAQDFQDTADIIAGLDLIITVDTAVAHLAGSLGKPTWILLPAIKPDWRWQRGRSDSPWYPSARLFRQAPNGSWDDVVNQVIAALS